MTYSETQHVESVDREPNMKRGGATGPLPTRRQSIVGIIANSVARQRMQASFDVMGGPDAADHVGLMGYPDGGQRFDLWGAH
jgi:hypothetical protein